MDPGGQGPFPGPDFGPLDDVCQTALGFLDLGDIDAHADAPAIGGGAFDDTDPKPAKLFFVIPGGGLMQAQSLTDPLFLAPLDFGQVAGIGDRAQDIFEPNTWPVACRAAT